MEENNKKKAGFKSFLSKWFNKSLKDVFDWHLYPEEPIEVKSIVEIVVFFIIVSLCSYLYYRWNVVPKRSYEINIEKIGTNKVYNNDKDSSLVDTVQLSITCDVKIVSPMTTHQELIKDSSLFSSKIHPIFSNREHSRFIDASFAIGSIIEQNKFNTSNSLLNKIHKDAGTTKLFEKFCNNNPIDRLKTFLDSLREDVPLIFKNSPDSSIFIYCRLNGTLPYFSNLCINQYDEDKDLNRGYQTKNYFRGNEKEFTKEDYIFINSSKIFTYDTLFSSEKNNIENRLKLRDTKRKEWYKYNVIEPFRGGLPMDKPSWFRLEDISQAYVDLKINTYTVDSIVLSIDFVGVTDFSKMDPTPDMIDMSKIVFKDPIKIYKIRNNGLRFHAQFKELENIQQIRVFSVTAIMSYFFLAFVIFCISAFFKIKKKFNKDYSDREKAFVVNILYYINMIIWGLIIYHIMYWTIMYSADDLSIVECNLITIPIVILILVVTFKRIRNLGVKKIAMYFSLILFLLLIGMNTYEISRMDLEDALKSGRYQRATHMMYDKIISSDSIDIVDYSNLRRALIKSYGLLENNYRDYKLLNKLYDHIVILQHNDTLSIYDTNNMINKKIVVPKFYSANKLDNNYICFLTSDKNIYIQSLRHLEKEPLKIRGGNILGFTKDSSVIISNYSDTLFYTRIVPTYKLISKKWIKNYSVCGFYKIVGCIDDMFYYPSKDSINIYRIEGNLIKRTVNDKRFKKGSWYKINNNIYNADNGDKKNYLCFSDNNHEILEVKSGRQQPYASDGFWNIERIKIFESIYSQNDNTELIGVDKDNLYFYNDKDTTVYIYNEGDKTKPIASVGMKKKPTFIRTSRGTFLVLNEDKSYSIYNKSGLFFKKEMNSYRSRIVEGYMYDSSSNYVYPLDNPSDSLYFEGFDNAYSPQIFGRWYFRTDNNEQLHIYYLESDSSLISKCKYLSDSQKRKLIDKLKNYTQNNHNKNE